MTQSDKSGNKAINTILLVMLQVGFATLVIVLLSVFGGLWLDAQFGTKPLFTAILIIAGIPITIVVMYRIARQTIARITKPDSKDHTTES
jgi:F0F1-type ATP synthase assembly protein I